MAAFKRVIKKKDKGDLTRKKRVLPKEMEKTKWKPGVSPNPAGRPKGARSKLTESFLKDFLKTWEEQGEFAILKVIKDDPSTYLRVAASLLPKELNIKDERVIDKIFEGLSRDEVRDVLTGIRAVRARAGVLGSGRQKVIGVEPVRVH